MTKQLEDDLMEVGARLAAAAPADADDLLDLLDRTEILLSRVDQSPSDSVYTALQPARSALVTKDLLDHSDMDVKVSLASCITEFIRITAPSPPYDDDLMKVIFQIIVGAFEKLDDFTSRMYLKRVLILETIAKVQCCVVMLDLQCDGLILEMFHYFLKTIRSNHPQTVFSSMEFIMTLVLHESEDISSDLLLCLLDSVKNDNKDVPTISHRLGEKIISNCAAKLKDYLVRVQSAFAPSEYNKIIASIYQETSDALEQNESKLSGNNLIMYEEASQVASDAVGSIRTVASFSAEEKVMELYKKKCEGPRKTGIRQGVISGIGFGLSFFMMFAVYATSFYAGARLVADGKTTFGEVFKKKLVCRKCSRCPVKSLR